MTQNDKLINRLLNKPKDFTWSELVRLLKIFGYIEVSIGKTSGSRARFVRKNHLTIAMHKPHPKPILKRYQINIVIDALRHEGLL